ncbi:MAG: hypothetical protein AAGA81_00980 [Acidobacteriota bacterium]
MGTAIKVLGAFFATLFVFGIGWLTAATGTGREAPVDSLEERELAFVERMQNVALRGHFTLEGLSPDDMERLREPSRESEGEGEAASAIEDPQSPPEEVPAEYGDVTSEEVDGSIRMDGFDDLYEISSVTKLDGNRWRFNVRMKYMNVDVTLPVVVPIEWAGDTPMVSITDFEIPGLGNEFGARVVFYDGRYAGTWDHGEYGGLMYGTIEKLE